jgi:hypothetical protein
LRIVFKSYHSTKIIVVESEIEKKNKRGRSEHVSDDPCARGKLGFLGICFQIINLLLGHHLYAPVSPFKPALISAIAPRQFGISATAYFSGA